ncbi:hypothetical protein [Solibacillus sp.]|uniref:hypothetical protein n=1 Tax=Solibacillus sp. TaxID=1909654 RepID=UPI003315CDB9
MASIEGQKTSPTQVGETIEEVVGERFPGTVKTEKFMYVGPATKLLPKYAIYEGGLPSFLDEHFEKCTALCKVFIDPLKLTEHQIAIADGSSVQAMLYKKVEEYFSEVK